MNEEGFRSWLKPRLTSRSVSSYVSNARRVEAVLGLDLDGCDASPGGVSTLEDALRRQRSQFTEGSLADCLTAMRRYLEFAASREDRYDKPVKAGLIPPQEAASPPVRATSEHGAPLTGLTVRQLLSLHGQILDELRGRQILRTGNSPVGDYAEHLFARAFGWTLVANSSAGHDAEHQGVRYQIKARRVTARNPSRQLSALRRLPEKSFDWLAGILFDADYGVSRAILIPHALVMERASFSAHVNGWRILLEDWWWTLPGTRDVTGDLKEAQDAP